MIGAFIAKMKIRSAFEALNQRNFPAFSAAWRDDCVFIYPGDIKVSGKFEGKVAIEKWFNNFLEQFPKINFTINAGFLTFFAIKTFVASGSANG